MSVMIIITVFAKSDVQFIEMDIRFAEMSVRF